MTNIIFQFTNLDPGIYSVRNTEVKNCYQILPGVSLLRNKKVGKGFVDYVKYFKSNRYLVYGGNVTENNLFPGGSRNLEKATIDYVVGMNNETYVSFVNNDIIVFGFRDEIISQGEGDDLFFNTYLDFDIQGHVSISSDGNNFVQIGILNNFKQIF